MRLMILAAAITLATAASVPDNLVVHEQRTSPRQNVRRADSQMRLPMRVGLKSNKQAAQMAEKWLMDVSHPRYETYGKHCKQNEVIEAFAPSNDTVDTVASWLVNSGGIAKERITHTDNKAWLAFEATVEEAEQLLWTKYYVREDERAMVACDQYHIPRYLQEHVDYIMPGVKGNYSKTVEANKAKKMSSKRSSSKFYHQDSGPYKRALDAQLDQISLRSLLVMRSSHLHVFGRYTKSPSRIYRPKLVRITLWAYIYCLASTQEDLDYSFSKFTPYIANGTGPIVKSINGGIAPVDNSHAGSEADMDLELAIPIVYPQKTGIYQVDDLYWSAQQWLEGGIFNTFLDAIDGSYCTYEAYGEKGNNRYLDPVYLNERPDGYKGESMCGVYEPTNVISISFMKQEAELPANYQKRQGSVSVFTSSGDSDVGDLPKEDSPDGCLRNSTVFTPSHPNTCPWLNSVGVTKIYPGRTVFDPESAANDLAGDPWYLPCSSGGGFSNVFPIPDYQSSAVDGYFTEENPPYAYYYGGNWSNSTGVYNRNSRGIPDVAANGDNTVAVYNGGVSLTGGTSAAAPIFAAVVNRINEERIKRGKDPVRFINSVLYANAHVLNDIMNGTNPGAEQMGFLLQRVGIQ
ncbi:hypothetical protein N0V90_010407 [Kalmusia sp. IMI 367209]|nr:hypothetical protein N0V90_010407 [Kalmusia sp. IMI 367209]